MTAGIIDYKYKKEKQTTGDAQQQSPPMNQWNEQAKAQSY